MDGTAGRHHLGRGAFENVLGDLAYRAKRAGSTEIKVIFLGDIFELIRTEKWFSLPPDLRPWGDNPSEEKATEILEGIIECNRDTIELLQDSWKKRFPIFPVEPQRIFIPGNHDRICNLYPRLRKLVRECLGCEGGEQPFPHFYLNPEYAAFARHGHEWDVINFEGAEEFDRDREAFHPPVKAYEETPIGDLLAGEFATLLPLRVKENLGETEESYQIYHNLRNLFDVRPFNAVIPWVWHQVKQYDKRVKDIISSTVRELAYEFSRIPFVNRWHRKHDRWYRPFDAANQIAMTFQLLQGFKLEQFERILPAMKRLSDLFGPGDNYAQEAAREFERLDRDPALNSKILYILYGHTHLPGQRAIETITTENNTLERVYINTGTWRPIFEQCRTEKGFVSWKTLTYTVLYKPGEKNAQGNILNHPSFETWTGAIKDFQGSDPY